LHIIILYSSASVLLLRRTFHLNYCSYIELRCFKSGSTNEWSQYLPITVLSSTHCKVLRNLELFGHQSTQLIFKWYANGNVFGISGYALAGSVHVYKEASCTLLSQRMHVCNAHCENTARTQVIEIFILWIISN
jgi:hypothetical protein